MKQHPNVPGSVSRKGSRWVAQLPPSMGRRGKVHDSEPEAWLWLEQENAKRILGITADRAATITVRELIDAWLAQNTTIKESTRADYSIRLDKYVRPHGLAALPIADVRGMDIDACLAAMPANSARIHTIGRLADFFDWAEGNRFTVGNPFRQSSWKRYLHDAYRGVRTRESTESAWTPAQLVAFIEHEPDPVFRDYWIFVAATGARRGESLGLRWPNVFAEEGWCWLADNITIIGGRIIHSDTPKNWKRRKAYFGPVIGKVLLQRRDDQDAFKAEQSSWQGDWVFDRRRTGAGHVLAPGMHLAPGTVTQRFNRHAAELELPPLSGPHGLRRSFATIAESELFLPSVRRKAMGHRPADTTGIYTKATVSGMQELAERLANLILPNG